MEEALKDRMRELAMQLADALPGSNINRCELDRFSIIRRHGEFYLRVKVILEDGVPRVSADFDRIGPNTLDVHDVVALYEPAREALAAVALAHSVIATWSNPV